MFARKPNYMKLANELLDRSHQGVINMKSVLTNWIIK